MTSNKSSDLIWCFAESTLRDALLTHTEKLRAENYPPAAIDAIASGVFAFLLSYEARKLRVSTWRDMSPEVEEVEAAPAPVEGAPCG